MRNMLLNTGTFTITMILVGVISFAYAIHTNEFLWVSRSGSIIIVLGIMLTIRNSNFSNSRALESIVREKNHYAVYALEEDSDLHQQHETKAKLVTRDKCIGAFFTIVGTVIWGYGGLIEVFFK